MAKIVEYKDLPLDELVIGKAQARTSPSMVDVDELATSIEKLGLLQPIVVCRSLEAGRWEILTGQRRFLAHKRLGRESIAAAVLDERVRDAEAKAISITENLVRRKPVLSHKRRVRMGLNRALSYDWFSHKANDGKEIQTHGAQWYRTRSVPQAGVET